MKQSFLQEAKAARMSLPYAPGMAPAPGPHYGLQGDAAQPLQAPAASPLLTPVPAAACSFDVYRPFFLNPNQVATSATMQSTENDELQINLTTEPGAGPETATQYGAVDIVQELQMYCWMHCVVDRGDNLEPSPTATLVSRDQYSYLQVYFYGYSPSANATLQCVTEHTKLVHS